MAQLNHRTIQTYGISQLYNTVLMISQKIGSGLNSGVQLESVGWIHLLHSHEALPGISQGLAVTHVRVSNSQTNPATTLRFVLLPLLLMQAE